jgi:chemotaxis methyl-accepting protein methylase
MAEGLGPILRILLEKRGFDFFGYRQSMLSRRVSRRMAVRSCRDFGQYLACLQAEEGELDRLLDALTINVSRFFRDALTFELIAERLLPALIQEKRRDRDPSLRIWSAGCAMGEEPYSVAILVRELLEREEAAMNLHLFATDIDGRTLAEAAEALYPLASLENVRLGLLAKYFRSEGDCFRLIPDIREMVTFSRFDILDRKHAVPPESLFGNFDLVLCRNMLIYFTPKYQEAILARLHHALDARGCLVLGEAEAPLADWQRHFVRLWDFSPVYRKK